MRAIFKKVAKAKATAGGNYIRDGKGRLILDKMKVDYSDTNGHVFIAEFVVESSTKVPVTSLKTGEKLDIEPNPPGSTCSIVHKLDKQLAAAGNMKAFVLTLLGYDESQVSDTEFAETLEESCPEQGETPLRGMAIDYETFRRVTKEKKEEIVLPKWTHVPLDGANIEEVREKRIAFLKSRGEAAKAE
jgi:hypothetical protein